VFKLISWKHSFGRLNEEYELARKKRQALDNLLNDGKISQSTHNLFNREIDDAIAEIEKQQKALLEKMSCKMVELEGQIKTLEILLTNFEIQHVTDEIEEEVYQRETGLLTMGLEAARKELEMVKEATDQLSNEIVTEQEQPQLPPEENSPPETEVKLEEETPLNTEEETAEPAEETIIETIQSAEEAQPIETEAQIEEQQET
jgi:hypothetical protein